MQGWQAGAALSGTATLDFLKLLRSFEEFLFEATRWLIFYPLAAANP